MRSDHPPNLTLHLIFGEVIGVMPGLILGAQLEDTRSSIATMIAAAFFGGLIGFLVWLVRQDHSAKVRREEYLEHLRKITREKAEASRIAQLNKPDFRTRLSQFVGADVKLGAGARDDKDTFTSRLTFWQLAPIGERIPPKPIEYIRRLLQHISKVIRGG